MNNETTFRRPAFVPILILLGVFGLLLFFLLINALSSAPRINVQNAHELREVLQLKSGEKGYPPRQLALSADGKQLLVTSGYRNELWQLDKQTVQVINVKQSGGYTPIVLFQGNKPITAYMDWHYNLSFQDMGSDTPLQRFDGLNGGADWDMSPDGEWLISTRDQIILNVTDIETGEERLTLHVPDGYHFRRTNATFSADGKLLATSLIRGEALLFDLFLWDAKTGTLIKKLGQFSDGEGSVSGMAFSHDGQRLAVGGSIHLNDRLISYFQLWDIASAKVVAAWTGSDTSVTVTQIAFSPDDRHLTAEGSEQIWLWSVDEFIRSGTPLIYRKGNGGTLRESTSAFSPDGSLMASGSAIYDVNSGELLAKLKGHKGPISDLAFSKDGRLIVTSSSDGTVRFWSVGGYNPYPAPIGTPPVNNLPTPVITPTIPG